MNGRDDNHELQLFKAFNELDESGMKAFDYVSRVCFMVQNI